MPTAFRPVFMHLKIEGGLPLFTLKTNSIFCVLVLIFVQQVPPGASEGLIPHQWSLEDLWGSSGLQAPPRGL